MNEYIGDRRGTVRRRVHTAAAAIAAVAVTGCGMLDSGSLTERALEEAVERASDGELDIDIDSDGEDGRITIGDGEGGELSFGAGSEVPPAFAEVVPLPASLEVVAATEVDEGDGVLGFSVMGTVESGSMSELVDDVDATLSGSGWVTPEDVEDLDIYADVEELDYRMFERGDDVLMVTVTAEDVSSGPHQATFMLVLGQTD